MQAPIDRSYAIEIEDGSWTELVSTAKTKIKYSNSSSHFQSSTTSCQSCSGGGGGGGEPELLLSPFHCTYRFADETIQVDDESDFRVALELLGNRKSLETSIPKFSISLNGSSMFGSGDSICKTDDAMKVISCKPNSLATCTASVEASVQIPVIKTDKKTGHARPEDNFSDTRDDENSHEGDEIFDEYDLNEEDEDEDIEDDDDTLDELDEIVEGDGSDGGLSSDYEENYDSYYDDRISDISSVLSTIGEFSPRGGGSIGGSIISDVMDRTKIRLVQSDPHDTKLGFAYAHATLFKLLNSSSLKWAARGFSAEEVKALPQSLEARHFCIELSAMRHFFSSDQMKIGECIIWATENQNIAKCISSVSSGRGSPESIIGSFGFSRNINIEDCCATVMDIFDQCTDKQLQLRAAVITPKINFMSGVLPLTNYKNTELFGRHQLNPSDVFPVGVYFNVTESSFTNRQPVKDLDYAVGSDAANDFRFDTETAVMADSDNLTLYKTLKRPTNDPADIQIVQSDASGSDGFGYVFSDLDELLASCKYSWTSKRWKPERSKGSGSHDQELFALLDFCRNHMEEGKQIVWVNDNQGCIHHINSFDLDSFPPYPSSGHTVLTAIRQCLIEKRCTIAARWIPRELNTLADLLSHLATMSNVDVLEGEENGKEGRKFPIGLFFCPQELFGKHLPKKIVDKSNSKAGSTHCSTAVFRQKVADSTGKRNTAIAFIVCGTCGERFKSLKRLQKHHRLIMRRLISNKLPIEGSTRGICEERSGYCKIWLSNDGTELSRSAIMQYTNIIRDSSATQETLMAKYGSGVHPGSSSSITDNSSSSSNKNGNSNTASGGGGMEKKMKHTKICRDFFSPSGNTCVKGEDCPFAHYNFMNNDNNAWERGRAVVGSSVISRKKKEMQSKEMQYFCREPRCTFSAVKISTLITHCSNCMHMVDVRHGGYGKFSRELLKNICFKRDGDVAHANALATIDDEEVDDL